MDHHQRLSLLFFSARFIQLIYICLNFFIFRSRAKVRRSYGLASWSFYFKCALLYPTLVCSVFTSRTHLWKRVHFLPQKCAFFYLDNVPIFYHVCTLPMFFLWWKSAILRWCLDQITIVKSAFFSYFWSYNCILRVCISRKRHLNTRCDTLVKVCNFWTFDHVE